MGDSPQKEFIMMEHSRVIFKNRLRGRKISLKRGLEIIYKLPFTGFIRNDKFWWWRNNIDWIKCGVFSKRKPQVLNKIFGKTN